MAVKYLSGNRIQGSSTAIGTDGDYTILRFTGNGTFTPTEAITAEILVIAGGGGASSGGGGAGGLLTKSSYSMTAQVYTITVGAGGAGNVSGTSHGTNGVNSTIVPASGTTITAVGGGGGGRSDGGQVVGSDGGSGGGAGTTGSGSYSGGSATQGDSDGATGFGYAGGNAITGSPYGGGGGGGASEVGGNATSTQADGGDGVQNDITGVNIYYAGGGAPFLHPSQSTGGTGGQGGGGTGGDSPTAGTNGLGGGGGGGSTDSTPQYTGLAGGSGVVIFRFLTAKGYSSTGTHDSVDEKAAITNVPAGTRYEETDTRKIFRYGTDLVSGADLKAYWKFDESSGNVQNVAGDVTGNATLGDDGDLVATGMTYDQSTPSGIGTGVLLGGDGDHGVASTGSNTLSQFKFLHYPSPKTTVCAWVKFPNTPADGKSLLNDHAGSDNDTGFQIIALPSFWRYEIARNTGNTHVIKTDGTPELPIPTDNAWHFYCFRFDHSLGSANLKFTRDNANLVTANNWAGGTNTPYNGNHEEAMHVGSRTGSSDSMNIYIAEMSIWNRILTDAEVTLIYNSGDGFQLDTGLAVWKEKGTA